MDRKTLIPKMMWLPLIVTLAANTLAYNVSRIFTAGRVHANLSNPLDARIPFVPWTLCVYFGCYLFWIANYVIACRQKRERAFRFLSADLFAKLVCLVCFLAFPTTNTRPAITGEGFWQEGMRFLYRVDAADNLFPSIHCLTSMFCYLAVRKNERVPRWYRALSFLLMVGICVSTLTTKQHVLIDVAAGVALAVGSFVFVEKSGFAAWYARTAEKIYAGLAGRMPSDEMPVRENGRAKHEEGREPLSAKR